MASVTIRTKVDVRLNPGRVTTVIGGHTADAVNRALNRTQQRVKQNIVTSGRVDTGEMLRGVTVEPARPSLRARGQVQGTAPHTIYQEKGTRGSVARPGGVLVFQPKGSGAVVFAKRTRGVRAARFFERAVAALSVQDFTP